MVSRANRPKLHADNALHVMDVDKSLENEK